MTVRRPAPSDAACDRAWDQIMGIAREHALIVEAYGGVARLATVAAQREYGLRDAVLQAHQASEPGTQRDLFTEPGA